MSTEYSGVLRGEHCKVRCGASSDAGQLIPLLFTTIARAPPGTLPLRHHSRHIWAGSRWRGSWAYCCAFDPLPPPASSYPRRP